MFTPETLSRIIHTSLKQITASRHPLWSPGAEEILIMIAAHESKMGRHLVQIGGGPALGIWQVESDTLMDNYRNFIDLRPDLSRQIKEITGCGVPDVDQLTWNPLYGCIHARLKLYRSPGEIPSDVPLMAEYAKQYYNSPEGAATASDYLNAYYRLRK